MECSGLEKLFKEKRKKKINLHRQESNETVLEIVETSSGNANSIVHEESIQDCLQILHEIVDRCFLEDSPVEKLDLDKCEGTNIVNVPATVISIPGEVQEICEQTVRVGEQECGRAKTDKLEENLDLLMQRVQKREETESTNNLEEFTGFEAESNISDVSGLEIPEIGEAAEQDNTTPLTQTLSASINAEPVVNVDTLGKVCLNLPNLSNIDYPDYETYMRTFSTEEPEKELSELLTKTICQSDGNGSTEALNYNTLIAASRTKPIFTYLKADIGYKFKTDELSGRILPHSPKISFHSSYKKGRMDLIENYLTKNDPSFYELSWSHNDECLCNESFWETKPFLVDQAIYKVRCCVKLVYSPGGILLVENDQETVNSSETDLSELGSMSGSLEFTPLSDLSSCTSDWTDLSTCDPTPSSSETICDQKPTYSKTSTCTDNGQISTLSEYSPQGSNVTTDIERVFVEKLEERRKTISEYDYYCSVREYNRTMRYFNSSSRLPIPPIVEIVFNIEEWKFSEYPTEEELIARAPRSETIFYYIIEGITGLKEEKISPPVYVRNLPWQIKVMPVADQEEGGNNTALGVYVLCNTECGCSKWSCKAEANFRIKPYVLPNRLDHHSLKISETFSHKAEEHGQSHFIDWAKLMDPTNGYVYDDDSIVLEIDLKADAPYEESKNVTAEKNSNVPYEESKNVTSEKSSKWKRFKNLLSNKSAVDPPSVQSSSSGSSKL